MKKFIFYIAAMAMAMSCNDMGNELGADSSLDTQPQEGDTFVTLRVTMEQPDNDNDTQSRVTVNDVWESKWEDGDVIYLVESAGQGDYVAMTYSSSEESFSGTLTSGTTYRAYYTGGSGTISPLQYNDVDLLGIDIAVAPSKPKMVSSTEITITDNPAGDLIQEYDLYMQNLTAIVTFNLTFNVDVLFDSSTITFNPLKIYDITLGGDDEGETQVPILLYVDRTKDVDSDELYSSVSAEYNTKIALSGEEGVLESGSKYTCSITLNALPFTIKSGERLPIALTIGDDSNKKQVTSYIENNRESDFVVERSKYYTLSKSFGLKWSSFAANEFAGGDGSEGDPFQIETPYQLAYLATLAKWDYTSYHKLTADINLEGALWEPIGSDNTENQFCGHLDGDNHTISGLTIDSSGEFQGLFGSINESTIKNITLLNPSVSGGWEVGALCGMAGGNTSNTTIENIIVSGGTVTGSKWVGGVVGRSSSKVISCKNTAAVEGSDSNVGGVVGQSSDGIVTACYNVGSVECDTSGDYVGGVIGQLSYATATACYNTGGVTGSGSYVGGVIGSRSSGTVTECYYVSDTTIGSIDNVKKLDSIQALNAKVDDMNKAAEVDYYTAGTESIPPKLVNIEKEQ